MSRGSVGVRGRAFLFWGSLVCASFFILPVSVFAAERIESFESDITVATSGEISVTETIVVQAEHLEIQHGIYRDFPTDYRDRLGNRVRVPFDVVSVERDGEAIDYSLERQNNGWRVYLGSQDVEIEPGVYTYVLSYRTSRQVGFFEDHDELYWNVTGNGWTFPIEVARATVHLPEAARGRLSEYSAYTGLSGEQGQAYITALKPDGAFFQTTQPLDPEEGLTIVVSWPKGVVQPPTTTDQIKYFFQSNISLIILALGVLVMGAYYLLVWRRVGRDPRRGTIIAQYEPPEGLSPAAVRYIKRLGYDDRVFAAALVSVAVKGALLIREEGKKKYVLEKKGSPTSLSLEERSMVAQLFKGASTFSIQQSNFSELQEVKAGLRRELKHVAEPTFFVINRLQAVLGIVGSLFFIISGVATAVAGNSFGIATAILILALLGMSAGFAVLIRRRTVVGRQLMDRIEGFALFLSVTEKDRMNFHNPPDRTPALFEKFLPYALALGVEHKWSEQFADVLARATQDGTYHPAWYVGPSGIFDGASLASAAGGLGSNLSSTISSSSQTPGSSSGGGGGGSSGGGGGGGGGGGF